MTRATTGFVFSAALLLSASSIGAAEKLTLGNFKYAGAARFPAQTFGSSSLSYARGPIAYNPDKQSLIFVGDNNYLGEFKIPALVESDKISDLNMAAPPLQSFETVPITKVTYPSSDIINRIGGMAYISGPSGPELLINVFEYYDAAADNTVGAIVLRNANNLAGSAVDGPVYYSKKPGWTSRWISPVPPEWRDILGGPYITGASSGDPITGRWSVGPTANTFNPYDIVGQSPILNPVIVNELSSYGLGNEMPGTNFFGGGGAADAWTHLSRAAFGFIPPGTETYVVLGGSGGHDSGVGYKITQDNGNLCGGYCSFEAADNYPYYWLFDVNDFIKVKNGELDPALVAPYEHGKFPLPIDTPARSIDGGAFDTETGTLYLNLARGDLLQGTYSRPPLVIAYQFGAAPPPPSPPAPPIAAPGAPSGSGAVSTKNIFNPREETILLPCDQNFDLYASNGSVVRSFSCDSEFMEWDGRNAKGEMVSSGIYFYKAFGERRKVAVIK